MKTKKPALKADDVVNPWTGRMNEREAARPGGLLMAALLGCAEEREHTQDQVARYLGVHYSYLNQLRNGLRNVSSVSRPFSQACAQYLGLPRLQVLIMAGQITAEDVHRPGDTYRSDSKAL
jgi:transcriptional regulator with XRE-family HTH domain